MQYLFLFIGGSYNSLIFYFHGMVHCGLDQLFHASLQCAHVMAMAVQRLFPDAKVTIGPWIENGFYYDFDMEHLTDKDLKRIKKEMVSSCSLGILFFIAFLTCRIY